MSLDASVNIIITTIGRDSLPRLIESFYKSLSKNDFLTVISDRNHTFVRETLLSYNFECTLVYIENIEGENKHRNKYGHDLINKYKKYFKGDFLMFADDDDRYVENVIPFVKEQLKEPNTMYIFKHKWGYFPHWNVPVVHNIGKCMVAIPNLKEQLPPIIEDIMGDFYWFPELEKLCRVEFVDKIIYLIRDTEL